MSDTDHRLLVAFHHAIFDGWSLALLFADIFSTYQSLIENKPLEPKSRPAYKHYIQWLTQ
jgi:NRPS condensation-like uncharacterized protein